VNLYRGAGWFESAIIPIAKNVPILGSVVRIEEMIQGQSISPYHLTQGTAELDNWDYAGRILAVGLDVLGIGIGGCQAVKAARSGARVESSGSVGGIRRVGTARSDISEVALDELTHTHPVPRPGHSVDDVANLIAENGYRLEAAIPVLKMPDGKQILAGGNHRLAAMRQLKEKTIPARVVEWSSLSDRMKQWYRTNFPDVFGGY
jgi:hypothetical protein